jgi:hypothetical protein
MRRAGGLCSILGRHLVYVVSIRVDEPMLIDAPMQLTQPKLTNMAQNAPRTVSHAFAPPSGNAEGSMGFTGGFTMFSASRLFSLGAMVEVLSFVAAACDGSMGADACGRLSDVGKAAFSSDVEVAMFGAKICY